MFLIYIKNEYIICELVVEAWQGCLCRRHPWFERQIQPAVGLQLILIRISMFDFWSSKISWKRSRISTTSGHVARLQKMAVGTYQTNVPKAFTTLLGHRMLELRTWSDVGRKCRYIQQRFQCTEGQANIQKWKENWSFLLILFASGHQKMSLLSSPLVKEPEELKPCR